MTSRSTSRLGAALIGAIATLALTAGVAFAHPESEGDHPGSSCIVTAEPGTIPTGGQFTVAGNFGPASIFVLPGRNAAPGEDAEPDATTTGDSFSVTFTASGSPGDLTVVAVIPETECGDTDHVTVTAATLPNTATDGQADALAALAGLLLVGAAFLAKRMRVAAPSA